MTYGRLISVSHLDKLYTSNAGTTSAPNCLLSETSENGNMTVTGGSSGMHCACESICQFCVSLSEHCLFCGTPDKYQGKQKTHKLLPVCTCTLCTPCCPTWQLQATVCTTNLFTSTSSDWLNCLFSIPKSTISSRMDIT